MGAPGIQSFEVAPRERFSRRLANLATLLVSQDMSTTQARHIYASAASHPARRFNAIILDQPLQEGCATAMSLRRSVRQGVREGWNDMFEPLLVLGRAMLFVLARLARRALKAIERFR